MPAARPQWRPVTAKSPVRSPSALKPRRRVRHQTACYAALCATLTRGDSMKVVVIGCGRVGSAVARRLSNDHWEVSVIDEREEALGRLGGEGGGEVHIGHGMDITLLRR